MRIGFNAQKELDEVKQEKTAVEHVEQFLHSEVASVESFENKILKEYKHVKDLEANFKLFQSHAKDLEKLINKKIELYKQILIEARKPNSDINFDTTDSLMRALQQIQTRINDLGSVLTRELSAFEEKDTHKLYAESEDNRKTLDELFKKARVLLSGIEVLNTSHTAIDEKIRELHKDLTLIKQSRDNSFKGKTFKGFSE